MFDVAAVDKLGYDGRLEVCLVLEEDGTEIDDEEYFQVASSSTDDCSALYCAVTGRQHPADAAAAAGHLVPGGAALHVSSNTQLHLLVAHSATQYISMSVRSSVRSSVRPSHFFNIQTHKLN